MKQIKLRGKIVDSAGKAAKNVKDRRDAPLFAHEPSVQDVEQGKVGDCYLVGTLAAIVATEPQIIKDCMKDNGDGTVTVRFFWPGINVAADGLEYQSEPVYINVPKTTMGNKGGRNALWVNIFELAYNAYRYELSLRWDVIKKDLFNQKVLSDQERSELVAKKAGIKRRHQCGYDRRRIRS